MTTDLPLPLLERERLSLLPYLRRSSFSRALLLRRNPDCKTKGKDARLRNLRRPLHPRHNLPLPPKLSLLSLRSLARSVLDRQHRSPSLRADTHSVHLVCTPLSSQDQLSPRHHPTEEDQEQEDQVEGEGEGEARRREY
jgi:hypothetical protein